MSDHPIQGLWGEGNVISGIQEIIPSFTEKLVANLKRVLRDLLTTGIEHFNGMLAGPLEGLQTVECT
jgi:hypothetical protein